MRITRIIASIFSLLLSLTAFGQPSPINRRAFALAGLATAPPITPQTALSNMWYWWVALDLTNGVTVTNQFIDRIQSRHMDQATVALAPTNSNPLGIWFSGSTYIQNTVGAPLMGIPVPGCAMLIFKPYVQASESIVVGQIDRGIGVDTTPHLRYSGTASGGPNTISTLTVSNMLDVMVYLTPSNTTWFTNGVACKTNSTGSIDDIGVETFGWTSTSSSFAKFKGFFEEFGMWTNINIAALYSSMPVIHKYVTNTYGTNIIGPDGIYP